MMFETYKLSRDRKKIEVKELNLDSFEKIGLTGRGLALKYKKGRTIILETEDNFNFILEMQRQNDEAVKNRSYCYARIDENKSSSKQNTLRDAKGKPIKKYTEPEDCYLKFKHWLYISNEDFEKIYKENKGKLLDYYDGDFIS
jgi:hypothetical protein